MSERRSGSSWSGGIYRMWYVGHSASGEGTSKIGYATSEDGVNWVKYPGNPIISRPSQDQDITVVKVDSSTYYMYVEVGNFWIDLLTSADGVHWTPYSGNPVLSVAQLFRHV